MPTSNEVLSASARAAREGNQAAADRLFNEFKRIQKIELEQQYGRSLDGAAATEEAGFLENLGTGVASGFVGTLETAAIGAATLLEEENELKARKKIQDFADKFTPEGGDKDSLTYKVSSGLGSLGAFAPTAFLGPAALPAAGAIALGAGAGEASERARDYGATEEERSAASLRGAAIGATELLPLGRLASTLKIPGLPKFLDKLSGKVTPETTKGIRNKLQRMAGTGVSEGAQEATAAILQNLNEAGYNPDQVMFEMGVVEEGAIGGSAGAIFQGVVDLLVPKTGKGKKSKTEDKPETQEEFDARQERARAERGDTQPDLFSDELDDAEIAELDKAEEKNEAERERLEDPDEVEFDMLLAEEGREEKEKEEAREQEQRDRQITIDEAIEDDKEQEALGKQQEAKDEETRERKTGIVDRKRDAGQQTKTIMGRRAVMDSVLDEDTTGDFNVIKNKFEDALTAKGYRDSKTTNGENARLKTLLRKQRKGQDLLPSDSDLSTLEAQIKEKGDVREQVTTTPDTKTTGDSVPSGAGVVGVERTESAKESGRPKQGRLDDSERDTGRPARRKGQPASALGLKPGQKIDLTTLQNQFNAQKQDTSEREGPALKKPKDAKLQVKDPDSLPTINPKTKKLRYKTSGARLIKPHTSYQQDLGALSRVSGMKPAKDIGRLSQDAKKVLAKPERERTAEEKQLLAEDQKLMTGQKDTLTDLNVVSKYISSFDSPLDALYNALYEVAEGGSQMKTPSDKKLGKLASFAKTDPMKPYVQDLGVRKAKKVLAWAKKNLSEETNAQLAAREKEINTAIKVEVEKSKTKAERNQEKLERQARVNKADPEATDRRRKSVADRAEQRAAKKAGEAVKTVKVSKTEKAKQDADANFFKVLNNPKTNLSDANTFQKARDYAEKGVNPKENLELLDEAASTGVVSRLETKQATKNLTEQKEELGQVKPKKKTSKQKAMEKAYKKFEGKDGVTRRDVLAAYSLYGEAYLLKDATTQEVLAAGEMRGTLLDFNYNFHKTDKKLSKALQTPISDKIQSLLQEGDIKGALLEVAALAKSPQLKRIARALAENMGNTQVKYTTTKEMVELGFLEANEKDYVAGMFGHRENIILLNIDRPVTLHTLIHEATHAAVDVAMLRNKSMPTVKFISNLYTEIKDQLGTAYGAENIYEFVAEAMSNPAFRKRLSEIRVGESNALVRFARGVANIIRRLLGMDIKPVDTSKRIDLDIFDGVVMQIMEPNPDAVDTLPLEPSKLSQAIKDVINPTGKKTRGVITWISDFIKNKRPKGSSLKALTKIMNLQSLADLAKLSSVGLGDTGQQLLVDIENQQGLLEQYKAGVDKVLESYKAFTKKYGTEAKQVLDRIVYNTEYGATIYQVDPTKPRSDYEGIFKDGNSLEEVYDLQQKQLDLLEDAERDAVLEQFTSMRNEYKKQWSRLRKALKVEFDSLAKDGDSKTIKDVASRIDKALFAKGELEVYFPLVREGKFRVSFKYNPEARPEALEKGFLMFENISERDAFVADIPNNPDILTGSEVVYDTDLTASEVYKDAPSGSFVSDILGVLKDGKVDTEVQDQILRMYVNALPETSYARSLTKRIGTFGYIQDVQVAMKNKGYSLASQSAKIESAANIRASIKDIRDAKDQVKNNPYATVVADTLINDHAKFAMSGANHKGLEEYFKRANQVAFIYTLGFNISSAIVNLSQIPLFAIPMLAPRYGIDKTLAAFAKGAKVVGSANLSVLEYYDITGEGQGATYTLKESMKKDIRDNSDTATEAEARIEELIRLQPLIKMAHLRGKLPNVDTLQEVGVNERANFLDKISHLSAYAFQAAERFNTQSTLIATYELALGKINEAKAEGTTYFSLVQGQDIKVADMSDTDIARMAAEDSLYHTQEVNSGSRLETAPPLSKQGLGRVAFMYKTYGVQMYYSMIKSSLIATDKVFTTNSEQRKIARRQLMGLHLSAVLFAGLGGIPLYGLVSMIYDLFAEDDEDTADEALRKYVGELGFKGPLSNLTGSDVAARLKLTDLLFQENRFMRDPSLEEMAGYYIGGPALSTGKRLARAVGDFVEGNTQRGFESLSPGGIGNVLQAARYFQDEGIGTRRGDFIYEDISAGEIASKAIGFAPLDYTFQVEQNSRNKRVDRTINEEKTKLLKKYYVALRFSDYMEMASIRRKMKEFNKKNPTTQITAKNIIKSMKSHVKTSANMHNGVTISPLLQYAIDKSNREYKQF